MSFFGKFKPGSTPQSAAASQPKKDPNAAQPTALEKHLGDLSGPTRPDGSDKFFGFENYGSTCYCNSIMQCLYYSTPFRDNVLNFPSKPLLETLASSEKDQDALTKPRSKSITPYPNPTSPARKEAPPPGSPSPGPGPAKPEETKDSPEYRKKQALKSGPVLAMTDDHSNKYFMDESLFTSMKQMFEAIIENDSRTGVVSPHRFLEILRREKEEFRSPMHQDAHEFFNILLNEVVENVDRFSKQHPKALTHANGSASEDSTALQEPVRSGPSSDLDNRWVHDLFEGLLTSETRCLTCETTSQRDEEFLDLSVDLGPHTSVTSCLRKFSEEEMLCERNKFHCDNCGGLQEAEKRMKIKRLPRILALHLKRFKYTEDLQRLQKVFHKVVYPFHLRLFNTTDDAENPDRLYELYAVVVHIGGGPYHGHYVSIIKTQDRGWLLFDDELVEPVDKRYVLGFFGGEPVPSAQDARQLACAYVLFYQETTLEAVLKEQEMEGQQPAAASAPARSSDVDAVKDVASPKDAYNQFTAVTTPSPEDVDGLEPLRHARTEPLHSAPLVHLAPSTTMSPRIPTKSRKELKADEKERRAKEKAERKIEEQKRREQSERRMQAWRQQQEDLKRAMEESKHTAAEESKSRGEEPPPTEAEKASALARFRTGSMSMRAKPRLFGKDKGGNGEPKSEGNGLARVPQGQALRGDDPPALAPAISNNATTPGEEKKFRHRFSLSRKKSQGMTQH